MGPFQTLRLAVKALRRNLLRSFLTAPSSSRRVRDCPANDRGVAFSGQGAGLV